MNKIFLLLLPLFFIVPSFASAAHINLTCADATYEGYMNGGTCTAGTWTFPTPSTFGIVEFFSLPFVPVYVTFGGTGTGELNLLNSGYCGLGFASPPVTDFDLSMGCGADTTFMLYADTDPSRDFAGTITGLCLSDTLGECGGGSGGNNGFAALINTATTTFPTVTGFTMESAVGFVDENLIRLFIGSGMSVLYNLRYWLMVLVVISLIVIFSFKALKTPGLHH